MNLATLFVEFVAKGVDSVKGALDGIKSSLGAIGGPAGAVTASLVGLAGAAALNSQEYANLQTLFGELGREIGSVFLPVMDVAREVLVALMPVARQVGEVIEKIAPAVAKVASVVGQFLTAAVGPLVNMMEVIGSVVQAVVVPVVTVLAAAFEVLSTVVQVLTAPFQILLEILARIANVVGSGIAKAFEAFAQVISSLVLPVLEALTGIMREVDRFLDSIGLKASKGHRSLTPRGGGGTEQVQDTYRRIQSAALKTEPDRNYQKEIADNTKNTAEGVGVLSKQPPPRQAVGGPP
ncbi:MAG: hypothetical protein K2R98_08495 [Gemmataceae bacterium]|nr:hypothetical protein [Gemmataceae bacterium]